MWGRVRDGGMRALEWVEKQIKTRGKGCAERLEAIHSVVAEPQVRHRGESLRAHTSPLPCLNYGMRLATEACHGDEVR
jgi:hypothetical protein